MPPECVVCDADATPPGALVRFRSRPEDLAWRERAERERLVGHPPDTGWLCADHVEAGRALAAAVSRLRHPSPPATAASPGARAIRPVAVGDFGARLRALAPRLAGLLGVPTPALFARTTRRWHPMDGAVEPDCPYTDDTAWTPDGSPLGFSGSRAWWSDGVLSRADESLVIRTPTVRASVAGHIPADGSSDRVGEILITGDLPPAVAALLAETFPAA